MQNTQRLLMQWSSGSFIVALAVFLLTGCRTANEQSCCDTTTGTMAAASATVPVAAPSTAPAPALPPVRIKAGPAAAFTDSEGNAWLAERGFEGGETIDRSHLTITNTTTQVIYLSERYSMTSFSHPVPNGKYKVKLHFAETYEGIEGPGQRVFSFNVEGHEFKDFDVWVKAGGAFRAYVETVNVEVADGKLDISFTAQVENPEINGIEILPAS